MRRRLQKFFPIVLVALVVQIFAPISACWAAGLVISDPLSAAAICQDAGSSSSHTDSSGQSSPHHGACCSLCCMAQATAPIDTLPTTVAIPYRHPGRVVWRDLAVERLVFRTGSHAQARAPPAIS